MQTLYAYYFIILLSPLAKENTTSVGGAWLNMIEKC